MAEKVLCPKCNKGNIYILKGGLLVCRNCGYDARNDVNVEQKEKVE